MCDIEINGLTHTVSDSLVDTFGEKFITEALTCAAQIHEAKVERKRQRLIRAMHGAIETNPFSTLKSALDELIREANNFHRANLIKPLSVVPAEMVVDNEIKKGVSVFLGKNFLYHHTR